jgi:hypothetical protein
MLDQLMSSSLITKNLNNLMNMYSSESPPNKFQDSNIMLLFQSKPSLFKGEFFFAEFPSSPREMWMNLHLDNHNHIYTVSRDSVGPYVCVGKKYSENSATFIQKYFDDYEITFDCFYFSKDSIEGNWKTTNAKGHFCLKRDSSFDLNHFVVESLEDIMILLRNPPDNLKLLKQLQTFNETMLLDVEEFKPFLNNSIFSVMIHGSQGGVPTKKIEREFEGLEKLFNQYKNINLLSDFSDEENESVQTDQSDFSNDQELKEFDENTSESFVISNKSKYFF